MSEMSPAKAARLAAAEKEKKAKRKYQITVWTICACVVLLVLFVVIFTSNLFYNTTTAVDIGGYKFTVADFNFNYMSAYESYYNSMYSAYGSYGDLVSSMLPDTSKSLDDQAYPGDTEGNTTWADYFEKAALERMQNIAMLCSEAEAAGVTADQEQLDAVEESIASAKAQAETNGFPDFNSYLARIYGKGMTEKIYRRNMEREALATTYSTHVQDSLTYTQEQKDAYYNEHKDEYDVISYRSYFFSGAAVTDDTETEEDETLSAEDAMAQAQASAEDLKAKATSEQGYIDAVAALHEGEDYDADAATLAQSMGSRLGATVSEWLLSADRKAGDVEILNTAEGASSPGCYVVYFIGRDNNQYHAVSGYYGLVAPVTDNLSEDSFDSHEDYDAAVREITENLGIETLRQYTGGSDKTIEAFQQVLTDSSDVVSESGPLDRIGIYDVPEEISDWLHDPARVAGDTETVYVDDQGCFILYFTGDDGIYADLISETNLRSTDYSAWADETITSYPIDTQWEMKLSKQLPSLGG